MLLKFGLKKFGLLALIAVILAVIICLSLSSKILLSLIHSSMEKECPKCTLHIKGIKLTWLPLKISASDIEFKGDPTSHPVVHISAATAEVQIQFFSLFRGAPTVELLTIEKLHVTVQEPSRKTPSSGPRYPPPGYALKSLPAVRVNKIIVHHSKLIYQHVVHRVAGPGNVRS